MADSTENRVSLGVLGNASPDLEAAVVSRYAKGAEAVEPALCCPTEGYETAYLEKLPREIVEKDYGCGDPSKHVEAGETVVDLGSGAGKICYILAQKVGREGRVIGLDFNDAMLNLARRYQDEMAQKLGYANVAFHKARIQDMAIDLDRVEQWLREHPVSSVEQMSAYEAACRQMRRQQSLIADDSVDVIVSNCVLNLVRPEQKRQLFAEMHRVLRPGGRAVISDIVCDREPSEAMMADPELWSGCISGAFREDRFLAMFEEAGFYGVEILSRQPEPWQTVEGVEFRSMTVRAYKGTPAEEGGLRQAVVYKGPWKRVCDEAGNIYERGERVEVNAVAHRRLTAAEGPYAKQMIDVASHGTPLNVQGAGGSAEACGDSGCC